MQAFTSFALEQLFKTSNIKYQIIKEQCPAEVNKQLETRNYFGISFFHSILSLTFVPFYR